MDGPPESARTMDSKRDERPNVPEERGKEPYEKPVLTCYGDVSEITKSGAGRFEDATGEGSLPL